MSGTDSWHCCGLNLPGARMTRIGQHLRCETSGVDFPRCSEQICFCFPRACQCSCLCTRVKSIRQRRRVRIAPYLSYSVACSLFCSFSCDAVAVLTCPLCTPWTQSLHDVHILATFSHADRNCSRLCRFPRTLLSRHLMSSGGIVRQKEDASRCGRRQHARRNRRSYA